MFQKAKRIRLNVRWRSLFLILTALLAFPLSVWAANDRQLDSGPFSFSLRGGAVNDSPALGVDGRVDYLNQLLNVHLFGTFDWLGDGQGEGEISNMRYGGGLALSKTFDRRVNVFAGASLIREMDENFGHAYLGGKLKLTDYAILSASYGFGFDSANKINKSLTTYISAEAMDWLKVGGALVDGQGLKANLYYHLTDPGNQRISGIDGELSYAVLNNLTVGANGSCDLTEKGNLERNWRTSLFVTYAFGSQKGSPIDIALDKNNPIEYPQIIRKTVQKGVITAGTPSGGPLSITQSGSSVPSCISSSSIKLMVVGGVGPYTWSDNTGQSGSMFSSQTGQVVFWSDHVEYMCGGGTVTITVTDANGATAMTTITILNLPV